jgi:hypothetical protein
MNHPRHTVLEVDRMIEALRGDPGVLRLLIARMMGDSSLEPVLWQAVVCSSAGLNRIASYIEEMEVAATQPFVDPQMLFPEFLLKGQDDTFAQRLRSLWLRRRRVESSAARAAPRQGQ